MRESETRTKASTSGGDDTQKPRLEAEGLATELLWASQTKASVVASVMNDECGPGPSGIADDFGVAVEMALKARLVFTECGPWKNTNGHRAMEAALKSELGHKADVILGRLPPEDVEAIKKLYEDCVDAHRGVRLPPGPSRNAELQRIGDGRLLAYHGICGPDVDWADFNSFIKWVGRAVHERYKPGGPEIPLPVGGAVRPDPRGVDVEIPSFADRLIEWVRTVTETTLPRSRARAPESRAWAVAPVGKVVSITVLSVHHSTNGVGTLELTSGPPARRPPGRQRASRGSAGRWVRS